MKSEYFFDTEKFMSENGFDDDAGKTIANELYGADLFFLFYVYMIML